MTTPTQPAATPAATPAPKPAPASNVPFAIGGLTIALSGVAHFIVPGLFRWITKLIFVDADRAVRINGASETAIGVAIAVPKTRIVGFVGLGLYSAHLGLSTLKAAKRFVTPKKKVDA